MCEKTPVNSVIDDNLAMQVIFWGNAFREYVKTEEGHAVIDSIIHKVASLRYMSSILLAPEIDKLIDIYYQLDIRRDDILMGLKSIAAKTGRTFNS